MIPPGSGIGTALDEYERQLRSEREHALSSADEETRRSAEKEIERLLAEKQRELMFSTRSFFDACW